MVTYTPDSALNYVTPFPYGSNIRLTAEGQPETYLSIMSAMAIDAAVQVHEDTGARIVIPGETPFEDLPDTTRLMTERAQAQGVPKDMIIPLHALVDGRRLNNTYLQAQSLSEHHDLLDDMQVIALAYHMKRVAGAVQAFGINSSFRTVESIFEDNNMSDYDKFYPLIAKLWRSELMARLITNGIGLPKGQVPNCIVKRMGARIVDIHKAEDGQLSIENDLIKRKRSKLERQA